MPTIDSLIDRAVPITPETLGVDVLMRFQREPDTLVIPVVRDDRPVGIVERDGFLLKMADRFGQALWARRPISAVMDHEPVVVETSTQISTFSESMLSGRASNLMRGYVMVENGRYVGVGTVLSLLQATSAAGRAKADELNETIRRMGEAKTIAHTTAKAKSEFLAVMSHELRTPMNGVMAMADLLRRQPLNPDAQAYVQTIVDSSESLLRILSDALDLSRAEAGELELKPEPAFVRGLMDEVQAQWTPRAAQDGVRLMVSYDGDPDLAAEFDCARMGQVFNNLLSQALRYARNGVVEASLKAILERDRIRLEARVRDNGQALTPERLETIFEPFAPGVAAGEQGLGLSISRQIVELMGGRIWAESNAGKGATFAFDLTVPRVFIEREGEETNVSELADLQLQSEPHILIVDDNATNRIVAQALCEMFGCTSECAEDGLEAVEAVRNRRFDLVLMDIKMPRMDGVQATQAIRELPGPESGVPIIALTANADPDDAKRYVTMGMAAVVEKPIKPERLRAAMNFALEAPAVVEVAAAATPRSRKARNAA